MFLQETIGALKDKVEAASGIVAARQRLIYKGKEVHNHVQLAAAGLSDGSVMHLVERLIAPAPEGVSMSLCISWVTSGPLGCCSSS